MKKHVIIWFVVLAFILINTIIVIGDFDINFAGMDDASEELVDLDFIAEGANLTSFQDGEITANDLDFSRIHKIYIDTLPYFFNEESITEESLKELLNNSDYVYYMPLYRESETVFLTIAIGKELNPNVEFSEESIARIQERAGRWCVTEVGLAKEPLDPSTDYIGLMDSYLALKGIHNAEVYFVSGINPESMINAVCFTGSNTETGEDEIFFVAVDSLQYDELGNLVSTKFGSDEYYDASEAEYTYEELREMGKEFELDPGLSGGAGGGAGKSINFGLYIVIIVGIIVLVGIIVVLAKKLVRR